MTGTGTAYPFEHHTDDAFSGGIDKAQYLALLRETSGGLDRLRHDRDDGTLPLLRLPTRDDDLQLIRPIADRLVKNSDNVLVLGTGGSSLGGRTLTALADFGFGPRPGRPRLHFLDNVDPVTFSALRVALEGSRTSIIAISKSGSTAETMTQLLTILPWFGNPPDASVMAEKLVVITEPTDNPLRRLGQRLGATILDHDPKVGGRYSVLSIVGLLPAMIAGLDVHAVRKGAGEVLDQTLGALSPDKAPPAVGAALSVAASKAGMGSTVMMPYVDRLERFGSWFRQLWAESLGKDGKGTTPIAAMGTVDQHSQVQLYLAGPKDKLYTLVTAPSAGIGTPLDGSIANDDRLDYLVGHSLGDLLDAEARATFATLVRNQRPSRLIALPAVDERHMGALFMHFMLETILAARLLHVDPFDQPAVEEGKVLARQYLGEMRR